MVKLKGPVSTGGQSALLGMSNETTPENFKWHKSRFLWDCLYDSDVNTFLRKYSSEIAQIISRARASLWMNGKKGKLLLIIGVLPDFQQPPHAKKTRLTHLLDKRSCYWEEGKGFIFSSNAGFWKCFNELEVQPVCVRMCVCVTG